MNGNTMNILPEVRFMNQRLFILWESEIYIYIYKKTQMEEMEKLWMHAETREPKKQPMSQRESYKVWKTNKLWHETKFGV